MSRSIFPILLLASLAGCLNQTAKLEQATGAFVSWTANNCICGFSKAGSLGTTHDQVWVNCTTDRGQFADMQVDVDINVAGERLYTYGSATGSLPRSGHPFTIGGVTDSIAGDFEPVGTKGRHQIPVHIYRVELPAQHRCDQFTMSHDECVDFPGASLVNLETYCDVLGDDWK